MSSRLQVIGAHSADFVWRAGGAVAKCVQAGGSAEVLALSYGERGESGELWKERDPAQPQTVENVKRIRHAEAEAAAAHLGASFRCLDLGDYPLQIDTDKLLMIAEAIRAFAPEVLITHTDVDPFNPDHPIAHAAVVRARGLAAGAGVPSAFGTISAPALYLFEPHQPELCNFRPDVHLDITSVWERKLAAMGEIKAQSYLQSYYAQRGEQRGNHARRASGRQEVLYAESFQQVLPRVVEQL
jgi:4-oxalomesaconate hydratase